MYQENGLIEQYICYTTTIIVNLVGEKSAVFTLITKYWNVHLFLSVRGDNNCKYNTFLRPVTVPDFFIDSFEKQTKIYHMHIITNYGLYYSAPEFIKGDKGGQHITNCKNNTTFVLSSSLNVFYICTLYFCRHAWTQLKF
jgi:hypothetical protein